MKYVGKTVQMFAGLAAVASALFVAGCATVEQNMAEQRKLHVIPGKQIHVANARGYQFCEVAPIYGTYTPDGPLCGTPLKFRARRRPDKSALATSCRNRSTRRWIGW